jgi:hypothetical protein
VVLVGFETGFFACNVFFSTIWREFVLYLFIMFVVARIFGSVMDHAKVKNRVRKADK